MSLSIVPLVLSHYPSEKGYMTFLTNYGQTIARPFIMWAVLGADRNILVDSAIEADDYRAYHPHFRDLDVTARMSFEEALDRVGWTPDTVDVIVQTHLHFDHCYNTRRCSGAKVVIQRAEYEFMADPAPFGGLYRPKLIEGLDLELVDGHRTLAPGVELLPVPGHSAGGQAVIVETSAGRVAIAGICTCRDNFEPPAPHPMVGDDQTLLPGIFLDARQVYASIQRLRRAADIILPMHEPEMMNVSRIP